MSACVLPGILLIAPGAFSSGSFAVSFGEIKGWKCETYRMVFNLEASIHFSFVACFLFSPDFIQIIRSAILSVNLAVFLLGAVYGIGNLSFGHI